MTSVLIVDDEYLIRFTLSEIFTQSGAKVKAVETGSDALKEINGCRYELCLLDVHLPDANGLDIMHIIRSVSPMTKIIIMTGYDIGDDAIKAIRAQGHGFIEKPFDLDAVLSLAESLTGKTNSPE